MITKLCLKCKKEFAVYHIVNGVKRDFRKRKFCLECSPFGLKNNKDLREYSIDFSKSMDERRRASRTKKSKKWQNKIRRQRKAYLVNMLGGKCMKCGYSGCTASLEFHHRDRKDKSFGIGEKGLTGSLEKLINEVKKCDLLCSNCHGEYHYTNDASTEEQTGQVQFL